MEDVLEISDGIQEALGRNFPGIADIDEDQLQAELDSIVLDEDKSYLDEATQNPVPPSTNGGEQTVRQMERAVEVPEKNIVMLIEIRSQTLGP